MGNTYTKTNTYDRYYNSLLQDQNVDMNDVNPYEVLGLNQNFSWDELVQSYRRLAKLVHPDKKGGSKMLFNTVTECFKYLAKEYKMKQADKPHHILKENFKNDNEYNTNNYNNTEVSSISNDKFNRLFNENKFEDEEDFGYGHMMTESSKIREDIDIPKILTNYSNKKFNKAFDKHVPLSKEVVIYKEPEPMILAKTLNFTELGNKTTDFSTDTTRPSNLHYADYMKAHSTSRLIDPRTIKEKKQYSSVDDFEADRDKITNKKLNAKELRHQKNIEEYNKKKEEERIANLKNRDSKIAEHFEKVNQLFITR